jgi:hypothetical protein
MGENEFASSYSNTGNLYLRDQLSWSQMKELTQNKHIIVLSSIVQQIWDN